MHQSQILPPGPHFIVILISMANFWSKDIFYKTNIENGPKKIPEKCLFDYNLHFLRKRQIFFCKNFWDFLKFRDLVAKSDIHTESYTIFLNIWHPCWPWIHHVHICRNGKFYRLELLVWAGDWDQQFGFYCWRSLKDHIFFFFHVTKLKPLFWIVVYTGHKRIQLQRLL